MKDEQLFANTDKELYREPTNEVGMEAYQPNVFVTKDGAIGMRAGGKCVVRPIKKWVELAWIDVNNDAQQSPDGIHWEPVQEEPYYPSFGEKLLHRLGKHFYYQ